MMRTLMRAFAAFCVGTVLTQMLLLSYFLVSGNLNRETGVKIVSLLNGIDITGNRLQQILRASEDREQPDFEEILEARKLEGMNMDLRLRSQRKGKQDLSQDLAYLARESTYLSTRREDYVAELDRLKDGAMEKGLEDVQRTLQSLEPDQAKGQLKLMYDEGRTNDVVSIVKAMSPDKRSEILAEFDGQGDDAVLADILFQIREGRPMTDLIDNAKTP